MTLLCRAGIVKNSIVTEKNGQKISFPEIWREYVGYDLDLEVQPLITHPDLVSNGNDYMELVDGNLANCVSMETSGCSVGLKVR